MYTATAIQTPQSCQLQVLQHRRNQSALKLHNSQCMCSYISSVLGEAQYKTQFSYDCTA